QIGHFINYFITPNNDVFFLDAQQKNPERRVTTNITFLKYYRPEIFFINAKPPEGFKIKEEPTTNNTKDTGVFVKPEIKQASTVNIRFSEKFNNIIKVAILKDEKTLSELLANGTADFVEKGFVPIMLLAKNNEISACDFLIEKFCAKKENMLYGLCWGNDNPVSLLDDKSNFNKAAAFAALGGHRNLAWTLLTDSRNTVPDYNMVAAAAGQGGHKELIWELLTDSRNIAPDYNRIASGAAQGDYKDLVFALLTDPRNTAPDYNKVAAAAAHSGHKDLVLVLLAHKPLRLNLLAVIAAQAGHKDLVLALLTHSDNTTPDYNKVIE